MALLHRKTCPAPHLRNVLTYQSVREGIVYVAMTLDDLKKYMDPPQHARVRGVHSPPYRRQRGNRPTEERITLSEALRDPEIDERIENRQRDLYYTRLGLRPTAASNTADDDLFGHAYGLGREEPEFPCEAPSSAEAENILVTADDGSLPITVLSDEEPDPEESSSQEVLDFRQQRLRAMSSRRRFDSDGREVAPRWNHADTILGDGEAGERDSSWNLRHLDSMMARSRMDDSPRRAEQTEEPLHISYGQGRDPRTRLQEQRASRDDDGDGSAEPLLEGSERYDDGLNDPNVTRARFHIRNGKYKVAIRFEPPVSGRFILLKVWANRSNVDLQSVIAKGYGGCRFFGAVEMR